MTKTQQRGTDYQWLTSAQAKPFLEIASRHLSRSGDLIELIRFFREQLSVQQSQMVIKQSQLRKRAEKKFSCAAKMFFTEKGLEQSTGQLLADYKTTRLRKCGRLADLCCGIGGDAMSFGQHASVTAVDEDPCTVWFARSNLELLENASATVLSENIDSIKLSPFDAWHIDPDQRRDGKRSKQADLLSPALAVIEQLVRQNENACIKLSPFTRDLPTWTRAAESEFVGDRRECKQQLLWFGELKSGNRNRATIVEGDGRAIHVCGDAPHATITRRAPTASQISGLLFEPHSAVIAAGLVDVLALQLGLDRLGETIAYLVGNSPTSHPALTAFEIVDVTAMDRRQVLQMLRRHDASLAEVKKRGVDHRIMDRFRTLKSTGDQPHTLILANTIFGKRAILTRRVA